MSFHCGNLEEISFPYSNTTYPHCGLCTVDCRKKVLKLNFGIDDQNWYELRGKFYNDDQRVLNVANKRLERHIKSKSFSPNLTFFKCPTGRGVPDKQIEDLFHHNHSYSDYKGCSGYTVYYKYPHDPHQSLLINERILQSCVLIQLSVFSRKRNAQNVRDLFSVLDSKFSLGFNVSKECGECHLKGGHCPRYNSSKFQCIEQACLPKKSIEQAKHDTEGGGKLQDGREVMVKRLYKHNYKRVRQFMNEIKILTSLSHPNLVTLYGCTLRLSRELLLVYEYIPNGTVADHLHGDRANVGSLTWPIRMNIAIETASALAYLHASDIIHRDIKAFKLFPNDVTHVSTAPQRTPGYVDPEYHQCYQLTDKSDVYSFGVVLAELISSMPAVDITRHKQEINLANLAINKIQNRTLDELVDPTLGFKSDSSIERMITSVAEVAFRCLQLEKEIRPTMDEVLEALKDIKQYKNENIGERIDNVGALTSA
ncbi:unnamed protein product [Camellia sinensis]